MRSKVYGVYYKKITENTLGEEIVDFEYIRNINASICEVSNYSNSRNEVKYKGKLLGAQTLDRYLKEDEYIRVDAIFYKIKNIKSFKNRFLLDLGEE